jgi:uncharacterized protein (TIGR03067 family)
LQEQIMRERTALLSALLVGMFFMAAGAADDGKAGEADRAALQGTWQCTSSEMDGDKQPDDEVKPYQVSVSGDKLTVTKSGSTVIKGTMTLASAEKPRQLDLKIEEDANNADNVGKTMVGIYELKGDDLKWCFTLPDRSERPKEFKSEQGSSRINATFKREKK